MVQQVFHFAKKNALNLFAAHYNADSISQALQYANQAYLMALKKGNTYLQGKSLLNLAEGFLYNDKDYTTIRNQIVSRQKSDAVAANQLKRKTEKSKTKSLDEKSFVHRRLWRIAVL